MLLELWKDMSVLGSLTGTRARLGLVLKTKECSFHPVIYECYNEMAKFDHGEEVGWFRGGYKVPWKLCLLVSWCTGQGLYTKIVCSSNAVKCWFGPLPYSALVKSIRYCELLPQWVDGDVLDVIVMTAPVWIISPWCRTCIQKEPCTWFVCTLHVWCMTKSLSRGTFVLNLFNLVMAWLTAWSCQLWWI